MININTNNFVIPHTNVKFERKSKVTDRIRKVDISTALISSTGGVKKTFLEYQIMLCQVHIKRQVTHSHYRNINLILSYYNFNFILLFFFLTEFLDYI